MTIKEERKEATVPSTGKGQLEKTKSPCNALKNMHPDYGSNPEFRSVDDDIEYLKNHPICCKDLTPEMLEQPEFKAL